MADQSKLYEDVRTFIRTLVFNPVERFIDSNDMVTSIRWAAVEWSVMMGGLYLRDNTFVSVAGQSVYAVSDSIRKIRRATYIKNPGTAEEERVPLEIKDTDDRLFLERISQKDNTAADELSMTVSGSPQDAPKYLIYNPDFNEITLIDATKNAGDSLLLDVVAIGQQLVTGVTWSGEADDIPGITYLAVAHQREKTRDFDDAEYFTTKAKDYAIDCRKLRKKSRQRTQMALGESRIRRSRSMMGGRDS